MARVFRGEPYTMHVRFLARVSLTSRWGKIGRRAMEAGPEIKRGGKRRPVRVASPRQVFFRSPRVAAWEHANILP